LSSDKAVPKAENVFREEQNANTYKETEPQEPASRRMPTHTRKQSHRSLRLADSQGRLAVQVYKTRYCGDGI